MPWPALPCPAWPCSALPCLALPCPALPCLAQPFHALPCLARLCPALPCCVLPCSAFPCHAPLATPCPTMLCLAPRFREHYPDRFNTCADSPETSPKRPQALLSKSRMCRSYVRNAAKCRHMMFMLLDRCLITFSTACLRSSLGRCFRSSRTRTQECHGAVWRKPCFYARSIVLPRGDVLRHSVVPKQLGLATPTLWSSQASLPPTVTLGVVVLAHANIYLLDALLLT